MSQKYVVVDTGRKTWCWARTVPRLGRGQHCIPFEALRALTGVNRLDKASWKQDPRHLRRAAPVCEPSRTDDEALANVFRPGGYLRTVTFAVPYGSRKYAEKRIRFMERSRLVGRFTDPTPKRGRGPASHVVYLTDKGADRVANHLQLPRSHVRFRTAPPPKMRGIPHRLDVADFVVLLDCACKSTGEFDCEYKVEETLVDAQPRTPVLRSGDSGDHCPDAFISLSTARGRTREVPFFLELDRGTGSLTGSALNVEKTFAAKLDWYADLLDSDSGDPRLAKFPGAVEEGFTLLVATTSQRRLKNLARLVDERDVGEFVLLATQEDLTYDGILAPIWVEPGRAGRRESLIGEKNYNRLKRRINSRRNG